jgi:2-keto-4-pentenoate hydratase
MTRSVEDLAAALAAARLGHGPMIAAEELSTLDLPTAFAVQAASFNQLGDLAPVAKISNPSGGAQAALIPGREVAPAGETLRLAGGRLLGAEIEVAAVLGKDLGPEQAEGGAGAVRAAIECFCLGAELIGTRLDDHRRAGPFGALADGMISMGYIVGRERFADAPEIDGLPVVAKIDGRELELGRAKHPFGGVIEPLLAWIRSPFAARVPLRAGMVVTTGSLVSLLDVAPGSSISMQLGGLTAIRFSLLHRSGQQQG